MHALALLPRRSSHGPACTGPSVVGLACRGILAAMLGVALCLPASGQRYYQKNLVTDDQGVNPAALTDPNLVNAWGISFGPTSPFWISDNGTGVTTLYSVNPLTNVPTKVPLTVAIPGDGTPTGQVFNGGSGFNGDRFLFVSEDGTISGWRGALGTTAETLQIGSASNVYKGVTLGTVGGNQYLYAANFRSGAIDVLKGSAGAPDLPGTFTDPNLPAGFAPFNVQNIGGKVYVTYAKQDPAAHDDVPGPGNGFVDVFNQDGTFVKRFASGGPLNSPWGITMAPDGFGAFSGDILIGNFGDGMINAFAPDPAFLGSLEDFAGNPLVIDGLWGLTPGNGVTGNAHELFFTAGPLGESHGLFGVLQVPEPGAMALLGSGILPGLYFLRRRRTSR